jgi:hypothetical protein
MKFQVVLLMGKWDYLYVCCHYSLNRCHYETFTCHNFLKLFENVQIWT